MLDILEIFLNLHGHTYLRLDGATRVDRRQQMMEWFNNDPKVFLFILSTRAGGTNPVLISKKKTNPNSNFLEMKSFSNFLEMKSFANFD
jgi:hypothetical protein